MWCGVADIIMQASNAACTGATSLTMQDINDINIFWTAGSLSHMQGCLGLLLASACSKRNASMCQSERDTILLHGQGEKDPPLKPGSEMQGDFGKHGTN